MGVDVSTLPAMPSVVEYEWRAARREDAGAIFRLLQAVETADRRGYEYTLGDCQHDFDNPISVTETDSINAFTATGEPAGMDLSIRRPPGIPGSRHCQCSTMRLYRRLGFRVILRSVTFSKPFSGDRAAGNGYNLETVQSGTRIIAGSSNGARDGKN